MLLPFTLSLPIPFQLPFPYPSPLRLSSSSYVENGCIRGLRPITSFLFKSAPKKCVSTIVYLGCDWKWIRSREQNSVPESRHASLYSVKVIKMSRPTADRFLILWSLHGSLRCYETDRQTDCTTLLSIDTQEVERGQLQCVWNRA